MTGRLKTAFLIAAICTLFTVQTVMADTIHIVTVNWPPYAASFMPRNGFTSLIISEAFKRVGHEVHFTFLPWKRAILLTEKGTFDALSNAYYSENRVKSFTYSDPYIESPIVFCARSDSTISYNTLEDLKPYRIGVVRNYVNTAEFDSADYLHKDDAKDDLGNLKKLLFGRLDLIVIDRYVAVYLLKNSPTINSGVDSVRFLSPPLALQPVYLLFSKKTELHDKYARDFNRGLQILKDEGKYSEILEAYGFSPDNP